MADYTHSGKLSALASRIESVRASIKEAAIHAGRQASEVRLLAISKTVPAEVVKEAFEAGLTEFGENKVQEARGKAGALSHLPIRWAVVGHLQSNKAKYVARFASEFHALDSYRVAAELNERLLREERVLDVFVQINTSGEETKFGLKPELVHPFLDGLENFRALRVRGLMTLATFSADEERVRQCFVKLREVRDRLREQTAAGALQQLSMGMSGDYKIAIAEGATVVRIGQAIFGPRSTPDSFYWPEGGHDSTQRE